MIPSTYLCDLLFLKGCLFLQVFVSFFRLVTNHNFPDVFSLFQGNGIINKKKLYIHIEYGV